ncbi:hypothetical protein M5K25_018638 [Dendrobium thyrsiflorum]|uniref:t-SNARE coiled-coil homology domain-containing protein n=1 Tax=Dendrobium thyrsiflorum TaxID=117978 RepID=A0ABD0UIS5_DENTH
MNSRRDRRSIRAALFDGIEEGGVRALYNNHDIDEHDNNIAIDGLQDRVNILKALTGDMHEELETHNKLLDKMGHSMDASRGTLYGNLDRFKKVFQTKSNRHMAAIVASFIATFFLIYYLIRCFSAIE